MSTIDEFHYILYRQAMFDVMPVQCYILVCKSHQIVLREGALRVLKQDTETLPLYGIHSFVCIHCLNMGLQWNPSIVDTLGTW